MSKLRFGASFAAVVMVAAAACGGKVVVDGAGGAGALGSGGSANAGGANTGGAGSLCFGNLDPSQLTFCGGGVTSSGGAPQCENDFCDADGNIWGALCEPGTCQCTINGVVACTCALDGPGNFCAGTPTCCPLPKI